MGKKFIILWLVATAALFSPAQAANNKNASPVVRGDVRANFARVTFEWPQTVYFNANANGKTLGVTFERKLKTDVSILAIQLAPYVTSAKLGKDGKTVIFTLDKPYKIRTFVSDNIGGIDLLGIDARAHEKAMAQKTKTAPKIAAAPAEKNHLNAVSAKEKMIALAGNYARLSPTAGEAQPESEAKPQESEKKPEEPVQKTLSDAEAIAKGLNKPVVNPKLLKLALSPSEDSAVLRLAFTERVALAVFTRARALWIVVNKPIAVDLSDFEPMPQTVIGKAELISSKNATVLRMPIDDGAYVNVTKEDNGLGWVVLLTSKKKLPSIPLAINVNTDPPAPPHVFIPVLQMAEPITVTDPQVGDEVVAVPLYSTSQGVPLMRDFVEFTLLETPQGIAVAKKSDDVAVIPLRSGLRIALPQGATLTPGLPEVNATNSSTSLTLATLFPYEFWKPEFGDNPFKLRRQIQDLRQRVAGGANIQEANEARLRMAQLYLSINMPSEALGVIDAINRTNPSFYRSNKVNALRGAANFLMYRFVESARDFSASELNNIKEIDYWRGMLGDLLGNADQKYDFLALNDDYISKYPPHFRQRLAIVAADRSIANKDYNAALQIFDTLTADKQIEPIQQYVNFLLAKIALETGQQEEALKTWEKLAEDYKHPFVQARAEYSRIVFGMDHDLLSKDKVIDRLERLRLGWHGDSLELSVLTLLGDLYFQRKDYVNAMRIWNGGVIAFPNSAAALDMSRKMQETFITMFNEGIADSLTPLEALALYYEYRSYTPTGSTGNEIIERLADRLVSVDLLDQAVLLLDHHMRMVVEKDQRSRIGTKLAKIQLLNRQPQKALLALQDSVYGENPLLLRLERNRVTAEAIAEMGQSDKALATLGEDNSADAERIRVSIFWAEKDWAKLSKSIEKTLKSRPDAAAPIALDESDNLMKLALAYVFQGDKTQLQYLQDYFGPLMEKNPNKSMFDFITGAEINLTTKNFDEVVERLSNTRSFVQNYKARIQTTGIQ